MSQNVMQYDRSAGNLTGTEHSQDLGVDGKIILEWILGKYGGKVRAGCIWLRIGTRRWADY